MTKTISLKTKAILSVLAVTTVVCVTAGATYAWFTARSGEGSTVEMGKLVISASLVDDPTNPLVYEPGLEVRRTGTISNTGSLPSVAMVDFTNTVTFHSDEDGKALNETDYWTLSGDSNIGLAMDESKLGIKDDGKNFYMWAKVRNQPGKYVVFLYGNPKADVTLDVTFKART